MYYFLIVLFNCFCISAICCVSDVLCADVLFSKHKIPLLSRLLGITRLSFSQGGV